MFKVIQEETGDSGEARWRWRKESYLKTRIQRFWKFNLCYYKKRVDMILIRSSHSLSLLKWKSRNIAKHLILRTLRSNDADGNENVKKNPIGLIAKQQLRTCITLFCTFLSCFCTTTTWKCLISRFMEDVNKQRRNFISLSELGYGPLKFSFRRVRLHLTK